jgi:transposase
MDTSILGIDVASRKLDLAWPDGRGFAHATIDYTPAAIAAFLAAHSSFTPDSCTVGLESTGDYHLAASQDFIKRGFTVRLLNPLLTRHYTRLTIRGAKTDEKDAELICRLVADGQGTPLSWHDVTNRDRELLRLSKHLTRVGAQLKQRLGSTRRKQLPDTKSIEGKLERLIRRVSTLSDELVAEATAIQSEEECLIDSIPGFGTKLSAIVHHELGDISRFRNVRALVAYAGLDPRMRQSGKLLNTTGRLSKRGSAELRHALFIAANVARRWEPELKEYYQHKRLQGRTNTEVLCIISRKLLGRINAVLRERRPYQSR